MRLAWRLARREVRRRPGRTLLVVLLVAVTVGGIVVGDLAYRSHQLPEAADLGRAATKVRVQLQDGDERDALDLALGAVPADATTVAGWEGFSLPFQRADRPGLGIRGNLWTADITDPLLTGAVRVTQGRAPTADDEVLLGSDAAAVLQLGVGDTLHLARPSVVLRVVGVGQTASGDRNVVVAPGYPIEAVRPSALTAVVYVDRHIDSLPVIDANAGQPANWGIEYPPQPAPTDYQDLLLAWVFSALVLGVLGIVVAAAFAASGRRQLVQLGQLGAAGADPSFARRFLALQGSVTGAVGALVGVGIGFVVTALLGSTVLRDGKWSVMVPDLLVIVVTTMVVATFAALLPTRRLAAVPVLTALAGRAPVAKVRAGQVGLGVASVVGGLVVMGASVAASKDSANSRAVAATIVALVSVGAVLGGVCALSPVVVDRWARVAASSHGATRVALRSLVRHRARSAAVVAAIAAVGAVGVAGASGADRWVERRGDESAPVRLDVITMSNFNEVSGDQGSGVGTEPAPIPASWRAGVESVVGPVAWHEVPKVGAGPQEYTGDYVVGDRATLETLGVTDRAMPAVLAEDTVWLTRDPFYGVEPSIVIPELVVPTVQVVSPAEFERLGWSETSSMVVGLTATDITESQREELTTIAYGAMFDDYYFGDGTSQGYRPGGISWEYPHTSPAITRAMARWMVVGLLLLAVTLIVGIGLALWAAEGRTERDQLVAAGASPRALAGMAGVRAWTLAVTGGLIAVPLGMTTLWVVLTAMGKRSPFPTVVSLVLVVALPLAVAAGAFMASVVGQRLHPVRGVTLSLD